MPYQMPYTQSPPSMPFYGIAPEYRPRGSYGVDTTTYPIYGPGPVNTMFMNYVEGGMQNNLFWPQAFFDPENDLGYTAPTVVNNYTPASTMQAPPDFNAHNRSVPPQALVVPTVPTVSTVPAAPAAPMATGFTTNVHGFYHLNTNIAPTARHQKNTHANTHYQPSLSMNLAMADRSPNQYHPLIPNPATDLLPSKPLPTPPSALPDVPDPDPSIMMALSEALDEWNASHPDDGWYDIPSSVEVPNASLAPPLELDRPQTETPSTPSLLRRLSSSASSIDEYYPASSYTTSNLVRGPSPSYSDARHAPIVEYGERAPPTAARQPPMGYSAPSGLAMSPKYTYDKPFEATGLSTSSEGGSSGALKDSNNRSKTMSPKEGSLETDMHGRLSPAPSRLTMEPPAPGGSSAHKRRAEEEEEEEEEEGEGEGERDGGEKRQKRRRLSKKVQMMGGPTQPLPPPVPPRSGFSWLVVSGNSTAANTAIGVDGTPSPDAPTPLIPAHPSRLACPVEDCDSMVKGSQSGGWSRHILETHHGGEGLWVCRCGRCFKTEHNRNVHRDACKPNTSGWEAWDRRIKQIHKTTSASLLEEYQTAHVTEGEEAWVRGEWRKLGIAGVILSVHASDPFRCRPRRRYEDQIKKLKAAGMWEKDQYTVQQNVNRLYQHVERLRADGGV